MKIFIKEISGSRTQITLQDKEGVTTFSFKRFEFVEASPNASDLSDHDISHGAVYFYSTDASKTPCNVIYGKAMFRKLQKQLLEVEAEINHIDVF